LTVEVTELVKPFGSVLAVDHVSFAVKGEVLALLGPSGCGKTTTLRCVAGLERPSSGEIRIADKVVSSRDVFVPTEKRGVGMVFQSYALWPHMKVFDNVAYPLKIRKIGAEERRNRVKGALELVKLWEYADRYPAQLSGGQQQRVALARAICYEPRVLLLDEPLSNIDAKAREHTRRELRILLTKIGLSSIYVTHDQEEAFIIADRIAVMHAGKIVQVGKPEEIYKDPHNQFIAEFIGQSNIFLGKVVSNAADGYGVVEVADLVGARLKCRVPASLNAGDDCEVAVRSNEIGLFTKVPNGDNIITCKVVSREYKGPVTDHRVTVGKIELTVTSHRFCKLVESQGDDSDTSLRFIQINPEALTIIPMTEAHVPS
jgi:iron(III) transport system ATP-binding protein